MPDDSLPVHINREELHGLDVPATFETTESFEVTLVNHGEALHVHLHLDDDLSAAATMDASNHYIDAETERSVAVTIAESQSPVRGRLKVASAYGAQTRYIDVEVVEPDDDAGDVEVDEALSQPQTEEVTEPTGLLGIVGNSPELLVFGVGGTALLIAAVAAAVLQNTVVVLGALVVLAGVLVATYLLLTEE